MYPIRTALMVVIMSTGVLDAAPAYAASAQPIGLEAETRAKLARVRAKGNAIVKQFAEDKRNEGEDGDECSIDIGNVNSGGRGRGPREVTIFIPGGVFQSNNRCR